MQISFALRRAGDFNPRAPCGARRSFPDFRSRGSPYFNPRAPCGARPADAAGRARLRDFNPRAPCGARRHAKAKIEYLLHGFQSTRPLWGATFDLRGIRAGKYKFQSTRPLWGATSAGSMISAAGARFQSTRPLWGATSKSPSCRPHVVISIHAPLVGRDIKKLGRLYSVQLNFNPRAPCGARPQGYLLGLDCSLYFNPRAPCGARRYSICLHGYYFRFQSTRPLWGATR